MIAVRPPSSRRHPHAVTLLEVLLVLCLLVTLASIAWPALERPLSSQRLRKAADTVRMAWGRARVEAMSSGRTIVFRYAIDGDRYSIQAYAGPEFTSDAQSSEGWESAGGYGDQPAAIRVPQRELPEGVTFVSSETTDDARAESLALEEAPAGEGAAGWSEPILFYPDGTTSTARLVLKNEYDRCIELSLRGLTGVVTVGKTYSAEG